MVKWFKSLFRKDIENKREYDLAIVMQKELVESTFQPRYRFKMALVKNNGRDLIKYIETITLDELYNYFKNAKIEDCFIGGFFVNPERFLEMPQSFKRTGNLAEDAARALSKVKDHPPSQSVHDDLTPKKTA